MLNMALRVTCIILVSALISYFHVISNLFIQTKGELEKYIIERGQRESSIFQLAEDNLAFLRKRFLQEIPTKN